MNARTTTLAEALDAFHDIDAAMTAYGATDPTSPDAPRGVRGAIPTRAFDAGWDAMGCAHAKAIDAVTAAPARSLQELSVKAHFIATLPDFKDVTDPWAQEAVTALSNDLAALVTVNDASDFWTKRADYWQRIGERDLFDRETRPKPIEGEDEKEAYQRHLAYEEALAPYHNAVRDAAIALILEPATDLGSLLEKRRVFEAEQMWHEGDDIADLVRALFDDGVRLAGSGK